MKIFSKDELLELKEKTKNCRITNPMFEDITVEDSFNEYVEAYKQTLKTSDELENFNKFINLASFISELHSEYNDVKKSMRDFLKFQFSIQLIREFDEIVLYVDEDTYFRLDYGYDEMYNVYRVIFKNQYGQASTKNKSLEDLDEQIKEDIEGEELGNINIEKLVEDRKKKVIRSFEYDYICEKIAEFSNYHFYYYLEDEIKKLF